MNRKKFLQSLAILPLAASAMKLKDLNKMTEPFGRTDSFPVLFLGHGSPMNAIEENEFVACLVSFLERIRRSETR